MPHIQPGVKALFFDAVGTLLFPEPSAPVVYAEVAQRHGLHLSAHEARARFIAAFEREEAVDATARWATSEDREHERWHTIVADTLTGVTDLEACFHYLLDHFARPAAWHPGPDVAHVLAALRARGFVLGMGSNYDARLWSVVTGFPELAPVLDRVVISAAVGVRKPGAAFFTEVARAAGCAAAEVLFVGDDLDNDYAGATAAGMHAILLDPHAKHATVPHRVISLVELLD